MRQQITNLVGATLHRVHQDAGELMNHLRRNSAYGTGDGRLALPQGLGDGKAEALFE